MTNLDEFAITRQWPAQHSDRIQLYSLPTPNGVKVSIMLEETGLLYETHRVDFGTDEQKSPAFTSLNPNGKIPAIIDPFGPNGAPLALFESGAILLYLAEKADMLLGRNETDRWRAIQWIMFQMGGVGPMFGQVGFFNKFAGRDYTDKRPRDRYVAEARRLLGVMDGALTDGPWFLGEDYSAADISMLGWVNNLVTFYEARELVGFDDFPQVAGWLERGLSRAAVRRGLAIPKANSN